ncbi:dienelactone hydrolase family protein [Mycolicibacterium palauense]|uniref:dienelactone hydrolase family protein n=1 Tax=Mycolicibacterium palauense TaxID=2034511 RepID=UPI000BFECE1A|nr:dienelactone hydrolase family protein [Mycolicibacterium palauense]
MTPLQRYIAEEIATDHVDGLLSRREAMRRLGLLGLSAAGASALIAACGDNRQPEPPGGATPTVSGTGGPTGSRSTTPAPPGMADALPTTAVTWTGPNGDLQGAWAEAASPRGAVLVIHENKGLNDWVRSVAGRLAGTGYSALAIDLLSEEGGTATFADPAEATAALGRIDPARFVADLKSGLDELQRREPGQRLAVVGFCFGGGMTWRLLASGEPRLSAAVPFYGPLPDDPDFSGSRQAAVLGFYGALDTRVTASEGAAKEALEAAGMVNDLVIEPNAEHAFFNDTGARYNAAAAEDAWNRLRDWFGRYLS